MLHASRGGAAGAATYFLLTLSIAFLAPATLRAGGKKPAAADEKPAAAAPDAEPTLVMTASVASIDKVAGLAKEIGLGEIPFLSTNFIEQQMPFIGPGGLAGDRPIGILMYVDPGNADMERAATFVFPVNEGKAGLKQFLDKGAQPVAGRTDIVSLESLTFRRTKDQFVFGQIPDAVSRAPEDVLTTGYARDPGALARVDIDIAAIKRAMPDRYEAFFAEMNKDVDTDDPGAKAGAELVMRPMRELTRLGLSLSRADALPGALKFSTHIEPFKIEQRQAGAPPPLTTKLMRAGFPEGSTLARVDIAYPPAKVFSGLFDTIRTAIERDAHFANRTPQQQEALRSWMTKAADLLLAGDGASLGVEAVKGQIIVYWVTHRAAGAAPPDLDGAFTQLVDLSNIDTPEGQKPFAHERYSAGDTKTTVHRLVVPDKDKVGAYLDAVWRDGQLVFAISTADGHFVERLLPLKPAGEATALASGWVDVGAIAKSGLLRDGAGIGGLDAKTLADLKANATGRLDWTASAADGALRIEVIIPKSLLDSVPKVVGAVQ